jgi:Neuraminidase (sialidase)
MPVVSGAEVKVVGKSGQISLGKTYAGKALRVERREDGSILLTAVAMVPESQLWTLAAPHRSRIERGLAWAAEAAPAETRVGALLKRRARRRGPSRGRRR